MTQNTERQKIAVIAGGGPAGLTAAYELLRQTDVLILDEVLSVGDGAFRKKSSDKMHEILDNGVTGLFVSHSVAQVRELCNTVLWLDHGKQILFSRDVEKVCNCYEEFLQTNHLPADDSEIEKMSQDWITRQAKLIEQKADQRKKEIIQEIESEGSEAAVEAALDILRRRKPELLNPEKQANQ